MATAEQYAKWIVDNQDKKGSPEFETVASAYKMVRGASETPKEAPSVGFNLGAAKDTAKDVLSGTYGRDAIRSAAYGALDMAQGAGQVVSNIWDVVSPGTAQRYGQAMQDTERQYQAGRYSPNTPDVGRVTGNVVPAIAMGGGPIAQTLPGRMAQGAKLGAVLGTAAPVDPNKQNFWEEKAGQVATTTTLGGLAPAVIEPLVKGLGATVNFLYRQGSKMLGGAQSSPQAIENTLKLEMQRNGVDWNSLGQEVRRGLVTEVQNAVRSGGTINPESLQRLADFQRLNIKPLQSQVTRDPAAFAREQNLARMEVGAPIAERLGEQNLALINRVSTPPAGAAGADPYSSGQRVISSLRATDAPRKAAVSAAYGKARDLAGIEADVPLQPVSQRIGQLVEDFGQDKIPPAVMSRLNEFGVMGGKQTRVFNIREAEKLKTLIGNNIDNPQTPSGKALTLLKNSVDDAINSLSGGGAGAEAAGAFQQARGAASQRFQTIDRTPALENALSRETMAPEKFVERFALRGEVQDVANLLRNMKPQDRAEVRNVVMDFLKSKSLSADGTKFSQAGFNNALKSIGDRKLDLIFAGDRELLGQLKAMGRVGSYIQSPPVASGVNYSGSATTIMDALDRAGRLPVVGALMGKPSDIVRASQVSRALSQPIPVSPGTPLLSEELLRRIGRPAGILGVPMLSAGMLGGGR